MSRNMLFIAITTVYFTVPFGVVLSGCGQDEWGCNDGRTCIKQYQKCDLRSDCPSGEDELNCPCIENQWQCDDGTCISKNLRCNNKVDCPRDNSDERSCPPPTPTVRECTVSEFTCRNGLCIDLQRKCDRKPDCTDNSDEQTCPCTPNDFKCGNGYCIPYSQRCDSNRNCQDGSDEENCSVHCQPDEFKCRDGACINKTLVCNKRRDCADASDEDNCETCRADQFRCSDGLCLMINQLCNGHQECTNGEDERNCGYIGPVVCRENEFECRDKTCIDQSKHCNGYPDCKDLSDEENCEAMLAPCPLSDFTCPDGSCIPMRKHCDGKSDCPGNHDEIGCADDIPCGANEYTCSDGRCIMKEQQCDRHYDCTDGGDERNCSTRCSNHEYTCSDGRCIRKEQQCDKRYDCADGGDERNCSTRCSNHEYTCSDGRCIRKEQQCDKRYDCADGGDERNCSCEPGEFQCDRSRCIPYSLVCNHYPDCNDKTDELNCGQCKSYQFSCTYGGCIDLNEKCDRKYDCPDGSDEENCGGSEFTTQATQRVSCNYTQFPCDSGDQCVPLSAHCDNNYDCRDYSDEENCAGNPRGLDLRTYPANQIIKESREVVFQCRDEGPLRVPVRWTRQDGQLPPGSRDIRGRLEMPNIQLEHTGTYVCEAVGYSSSTHGSKVTVFLRVEPFDQPSTRPPKACAIGEATCSNGECIPKHYVCNGQYDCSDGSDELRCNPHGCEPNEFRCDNKKCVRKTWLCDSEDDCGDGSDERNCGANLPGSPCRYNEFECKSGNQCIPKSFHCDLEIDCQDGSDEVGCSKVYIQTPPPPMIVLEPGNVFTITCTAVGVPTPEVVWRLNWGHIPEKCSVTSNGGFGTLTCPDIQESDQGAYSCEAMNSRGSVFAIPDTILVVKGPQGVCPRGTFNQLARTSDECISCFCFGVTSECKSADLFIYQLLPPVDVFRVVNVQITPSGGIEIRKEESHYQSAVRPLTRNGFQLSATENDLKSYTFVESQYPYFALPEAYYGNQLKSYGGYIKYVVEFGGTGSQLNIPDVILTGNGYTLVYRGSPLYPRRKNEVAVRYFPGNWYRLVESHSGPGGDINFEFQKEVLATREDLMMALYNVDNILIRAQYLSNELDTTILDINMDSAGVRNTGQGKAAYVEECSCPAGYSGLSCEKCSQGFLRQDVGPWLGKCYNDTPPCSPGTYGDPKRGIPCQTCPCPYTSPANQFSRTCQLDSDGDVTCDCPAGYIGRRCEQCADGYAGNPLVPGDSCRQSYCDPAGSVFSAPEPTTGHCVCKDYTTGPTCNQCKANTFYLASSNIFGCISCFCMGINTTCTSSNMYRNQVSSAFTRDNQDFKLALANKPDETISNIEVNPSAREIIYRQFTPEVYYWVLPSKFLYNKVTSYGGNLRYTLRYVPTPGGQISRNNAPDVEIISDNEVRLLYFSREQIEPNKLVTITVPLLEQYWQRVDGQAANREHLLMALAELDNILIKATYTTNTQEAALISVSLDIADERNTGQSRAIEVEQCACPQGYRGTSCEECDAGYTRVDEGLYLGICEPCNCNGHSTQCDSDSGVCLNCGDHTEGDQCNVCQPGYVGNPLSGGVCQPESPTTCVCDPRGSIHTNCNARNQCVCKTNVEGQQCDQCREGTFDLSAYHPEGCLECYCSGVAHSCQSSNLYITQIPTQIIDQSHNFTLTDANRQHVIRDGFLLNVEKNEIGYDFSNQQGQRLFWSLPPAFTGNKVTSYGGNLTFTQHYNSAPSAAPYYDTDVVIIGTTSSLFWTANDILQPSVPKTVTVPLVETNWHRLDPSSQPSSRSDLLTALSNIEAILIRASYSNQTVQSFLSDVSLDTAVSQHTGQGIATAVEVCRCPTGYKGTSCESCSGGYYEDYDGTCKKCPCNNNEVSCLLGVSREVECKCKAQYRGLYCETVGPMDNNQDVEPSIPPSRPSTNPLPTINVSILEPIIQIVETGKTVRYRCTGKSQGPVRLEWKKEGGDLPPGRAIDDRQGTLTITNVRVTDSGTYICRAFDGYSFVTERAQLTVGGGPESLPRVTVQPRYLHVREGEPVEFHCTASGNPQPVLKWVGGQNNRLNPQSSFVNGIFYIPYATRSDEANYQCIATNTKGSDAESVVLYVREPDIPTEVTPLNRLDVQPSEYSGSPGDTVRLHCVSSGQHNIQIRWSRYDGKPLPASATDQNGVLTIYSVNPDDAGIYVCTAFEASTGVREQVQARINIISSRLPPRIHIEPDTQTVSQGSIAELHCLASDNQHVNFQWSKVGDDLPSNVQINGGVLRILSAQVKDRGVYVCKIEGPAGIAQSSAIIEIKRREAPTVELYPKATQTVVEGRSAIFQCRLTGGVPLPTLQWSRPNKEPLSSRVEQLSSGVLRFNSVTRAEEGQYICTAENEAGSITAVGSLEVHTIPMVTIYPAGPVFVSPGQRVRLECRASGYPQPQVQWSKHQHQSGLVLYTSQAVTSRTPQSAIYVISSAMRGDEGSYTCLATNDAGLVEERIQVFVVNESTSGPTRGDIPSVDGSSLATHTGGGVIIEDEDFSVPVGGYTQMRCIVRENDQNIFLKWIRRDGKPLSPSHWWQDGILYIKNAQLSDAGEYSCQGIDPSGSILFSANARLVVTVGNKLCADEFGAPPRITLEPTRQVVRPGDNARIICSATGDQPIEITWSAVGKVLPSSVSTDRGYILFQGITAADAGRYVCRARNSAGESESVAEVIVNEHTHGSHPVVTAIDRNQRAIEGSSVQLRCDTDNRTEITWTREYQPLPSSATLRGSILRIDGLRPEDAGRYICHANSVSDYIDLSVDSGGCKRSEFRCENTTCIPLEAVCDGHQDCIDGLDEQSCQLRPGRDLDNIELRIEPSRHEVQIGDTLDLRCLVDGYPGKQITWNKADDNLGSNVQVSGTLLRITNADIHNGGVYRCSTSVRSGTVDKDYILNVEDKPNRDAESVQTITAAYGKTVVMDCRTDLEPPVQFTWTKHGSVLPAKATVKDEKLSIPNVTYKDAGNYICTASNGQVSVDIPKLITVTGAVPFFAQAPVSYLALPTLPNAYLNFNIGISFKPEHPNGLILYNGQQRGGEGDFVSLGLRNGVPEFRFDMGSGPAVIHGASPVSMGQWHTIQISRQRKNGSMYVDDEGPFVGSGPKKYQGLDLFQQLFIGGVPDYNDISKLNGFESGFVGCISRLVIDKVEHDLIQDARLTEGVTNCETCAINPCLNNGVCQEAPTKQGYTCLCPRGFSGENCARIGEACYPGACGTGRCMNVEEGLECYCQLHKSGFHCEHDISITVPSFSKKAYLAYPTPKALRKLKIALKFSAKDTADGLLFYCAQNEDGQGDFVSLAIKDGRVEFRFDTGSGPSVLQSTRNIIPGQWITVSADRDYHEGRLSVSGELPVSAPTTGRTKGLNLRTPLFIGGYDKQHIKLSNGVGVKHGFSGCISEVEVSGLNLNLIHSAVDAANVEECSADVAPDPCQHQTCNNHGDCLPTSDGRHFECYCHPGYSGTTCENNEDICAVRHPCQNRGSCIGNSSYYKCNCPLGYGGVHCEQNVELATEVRFQGDGYIELDNNLLPHTNPDERETITVEFSTHSQDAVILWHGQMPDTEGKGQDYLSLAIVNGYLELSFELGSGPAEIRASTKKVNDGARHIAVIERQASDGSLELDGDITEIGESPGGLTQLNTKGSIYLGGLPNVDLMTGGRYVHGLHGCIHSLDIQNSGHINFSEKALSAINAQPCTSSFDDYEDNSTQGRRDEIIH